MKKSSFLNLEISPKIIMATYLLIPCLFLSNIIYGQLSVHKNFGLKLTPESNKEKVLETSLNEFLSEASAGSFSKKYTDATHIKENEFFFNNILKIGTSRNKDITFNKPIVLKSYSFDESMYYITLSFTGIKNKQPFIYKIIELKAVPFKNHYKFYCLFQEKTKLLKKQVINSVSYYYTDTINLNKAKEFVDFKNTFSTLTKTPSSTLNYYNFQSLDELLKAYGLLYDANKCNFLSNDLGITDNQGNSFITGTNNESYIFDYLTGYLRNKMPNSENIYRAFEIGMATYYGGYGLSGDTIEVLKRQFREELKSHPNLNFLQEFKLGRKASINKHFSFYVMCSFLCQEIIKKHGFEKALQIVYSGKDGDLFFTYLKKALNIDASNFHDSIVQLINN